MKTATSSRAHDAKKRALFRAKRKASERGIALIMVLGTLAVLIVMLADFKEESAADISAAVADRDGVKAEYMAKSALNLSRLLIATEPTIRTAVAPIFMMMKRTPPQLPVWEFSDRILGFFNDEAAGKEAATTMGIDLTQGKNLTMPGGSFELTVVDEDAKINVNLGGAANTIQKLRLARELFGIMPVNSAMDPLFDARDKTGQTHSRAQICQALIDWADDDDSAFSCDLSNNAPSSSGPEDAYYQLLPKPYRRKNAPYDSLDEVRMVRGISDTYWSTFADPQPNDPKKRVFTVWGTGAVNVNTANAQTLLALVCAGAPTADVCTDVTQAATFLTGVTMLRGLTMGAPIFGSAKEFVTAMKGDANSQAGGIFKMMGLKPIKFTSEAEFQKSVSTESKVFSIYAVGIVKGFKRETRSALHTVVDFRNAAALTSVTPTTGTTTTGATTTPTTTTTQTSTTDAITAALKPGTGGSILYYHQE